MSRRGRQGEARAGALAVLAVVQSVAAVFFCLDAAADIAAGGVTPHVVIEAIVAIGLLGGIAVGLLQLRGMLADARRRETALALATGAFSEVMTGRFQDWRLTPAEADVAVFALKGCDVAEIARLRNSAPGTVRAQLASVYAKAGVNSRAALACVFLEDLLSLGDPS